nr:ribonuclease H-like domain-containing protein [Tanacetum cinerariifolium]
MRMEQYLTHTYYARWEVIINGDSPIPEPPVVAIPDEHLLKFHSIKDAKSPWEAIKIRFQKLISQLELNGEVISQEDANIKLLRSLPPTWNNIALIMRNKPDIETLSMNDLYNNLKVYEAEIKGQSSSRSNSHNVAFVSSENTSSINETVNAAHDIPAVGSKKQPSASSYANNGNKSGDNKRRVVIVETPTSALVVQDGLGQIIRFAAWRIDPSLLIRLEIHSIYFG